MRFKFNNEHINLKNINLNEHTDIENINLNEHSGNENMTNKNINNNNMESDCDGNIRATKTNANSTHYSLLIRSKEFNCLLGCILDTSLGID